MNEWHEFNIFGQDKNLKFDHSYNIKFSDGKIMKATWRRLEPSEYGWWEYEKDFESYSGIVAWKEIDKPEISQEFTDEQFDRIDRIQSAAEEFLVALAETDDKVWELEDVWSMIYHGCHLLHKRGRNIRLPTHVTTPDGKEYITDWYEEDEDADVEH